MLIYTTDKLKVYQHEEDYGGERVCCSCGHNIKDDKDRRICEIDTHYIGYLECFDNWCKHWKRDRKWDKK